MFSQNGLITTMAATPQGAPFGYAVEGSVFVAGAVIQWLRDELRILDDATQSELLATSVPDTGGVVVVPAFTGLGAPYWDSDARGTLFGITRGTGWAHIVRAALESIALQSYDVICAMQRETGVPLTELKVDGGASANGFLMQFQSDLLHTAVRRPKVLETTALGAAYLAGLCCKLYTDLDALRAQWQEDVRFTPLQDEAWRMRQVHRWQRAVSRTQHWLTEEDVPQ